jgi:phosphoribosylamine--glycine ligase
VKVMVVGGGGREHTLVWRVAHSPRVDRIYCAPGNPGMKDFATCVNISVDDIRGLADFAEEKSIDLTIVGPEAPLVQGIVDEFEKRGLNIFGPGKEAAQIEGSKVFSKELMKKYKIPTGDYRVFEKAQDAMDYINTANIPLVVKAEGLAAGKGVIIAHDRGTAKGAVKDIMIDRAFGKSTTMCKVRTYRCAPFVTVKWQSLW